MAIQWGSWDYSGNNGMRVGIDVSRSSVKHSSSSVTFTFKIYTQNQYRYNDNQRLVISGDASGTINYSNTGGHGATVLRATRTVTYNYPSNSYGSSPGKRSVTAKVTVSYNGSTPSKKVTSTIPARPYATPNDPTGIDAVLSGDQITVTWTRNPTTGRPYSSQTLQTRTRVGDGDWSSWTTTSLSGTAVSYIRTSIDPGASYQFRVRAENTAGNSGWLTSDEVLTQPPNPFNVAASLTSAGVLVTWENPPGPLRSRIERSVNGGPWVLLAGVLQEGVWEYLDTSPGGGSNQYRVQAYRAGVESDWVLSNEVASEIPPLAPSNLQPNSVWVDPATSPEASWIHNPGPDGAAQTAYELSWSTDGSSSWTESGKITSTLNRGPLFGSPLPPLGSAVLFRVRTWGQHPDPSPWSPASLVYPGTAPTATITAPDLVVNTLPQSVAWTYFQAQGQAQGQAQVRLLRDGVEVWSTTVYGSSTSVPLGYPLTEGPTWRVEVRVQTVGGLWSSWSYREFTVDLLPPHPIVVTPTFVSDSGTMSLDLEMIEGPGSAPVESFDVQRRIDGGPWVTIHPGAQFPPGMTEMTVLDLLPTLNGTNEYRLLVTSTSPSYLVTDPVPAPVAGFSDSEWVFVNWGPGFQDVVRARCEPRVSEYRTRARLAQPVAGRQYPVMLVGSQRSRSLSVGFEVDWDEGGCSRTSGSSSADEWLLVGSESRMVVYRDWRGRRVFGSMDEINSSDIVYRLNRATVNFTLQQVDYREGVGL